MSPNPRPARSPLPPTEQGSLAPGESLEVPQLSPENGVQHSVSSVAMDRELLAMAGAHPQAPVSPATALPGEGSSDAEVMLRVKTGDNSAFDYLVQKYRRPMVSFMYRAVHNSAVAEDLAQEVFLRVYRSRETYEPSAKFTTWLYRIATNLVVNHVRDTRNERPENVVNIDESDDETGMKFDLADSTISAEEMIVRRERMIAIRRRVQALPERQKMAVLMHKYQQMDYKQIAEVLKLSESATKSLLFRAYETLRGQLKEFA